MKKKNLIYGLIACLGLSFTACQDMLTPSSERHSYEVGKDTLYSYWGILRSMQNIAERYVVLGEFRGELVEGTNYLSDSIQSILDYDMGKAIDGSNRYLKIADYYHVINSCNAYLHSYDSLRMTGTLNPYMKKEAAQVSAIRAWTYLQLVQVYGRVPFYTEPLLTSNKISSFMKAPTMVTVDDLADKLVGDLEKAAEIEAKFGFPQYQSYGRTSTVAHSTKLMIPVNIILGDLYLAKGDKASCIKAAQYYYNYLSGNLNMSIIPAGGALPAGYRYSGYRPEGSTRTSYFPQLFLGEGGIIPWTEQGQTMPTLESITAIPSSTNKIWGTVLRGINNIYGFDAEISVRTYGNDTTSSTAASVHLTPKYDKKQIIASKVYNQLCDEQKYELYVGAGPQQSSWILTVDPNVGDARRYWVQDIRQSYPNGTSAEEKFIMKQNPNGQFTTTFPIIYRKSQIWLRFAEALCNAGYPGYAFAILKDGLCNNQNWLPTVSADNYIAEGWRYIYIDAQGNVFTSTTGKQVLADSIINTMSFETDAERNAQLKHIIVNIDSIATKLSNEPHTNGRAIVNYIPREEMENQPSYLNFNLRSFTGKNTNRVIYVTPNLISQAPGMVSDDYYKGIQSVQICNGIHARGCGEVRVDDRALSAYNYVDMVSKKAKENYGITLDRSGVYNPANKELVQKCVEDLIVDEEALELAFEGCRFFDLMRVAHRRRDASYLAERVGKRNPTLKAKLMNAQNWYFPLP